MVGHHCAGTPTEEHSYDTVHVGCSCISSGGGSGVVCGPTAEEEEHTLVGRPSLQYASGAIRRAIQTHTILLFYCSAAHPVALNKTMCSGASAVG